MHIAYPYKDFPKLEAAFKELDNQWKNNLTGDYRLTEWSVQFYGNVLEEPQITHPHASEVKVSKQALDAFTVLYYSIRAALHNDKRNNRMILGMENGEAIEVPTKTKMIVKVDLTRNCSPKPLYLEITRTCEITVPRVQQVMTLLNGTLRIPLMLTF